MATALKKPQSPATRAVAPAAPTALQRAQELMKEYAGLSAQQAGITAKAKEDAAPIVARMEEVEALLFGWAQSPANAAEFGGNKLLKTEWGSFGFKANPKKLKWDLDKTPDGYEVEVARLVKKFLPTAITEKVDEAKVARLWDDTPKLATALSELGGSVEQLDKFTITLSKLKA
jgi:hypothetical protein